MVEVVDEVVVVFVSPVDVNVVVVLVVPPVVVNAA